MASVRLSELFKFSAVVTETSGIQSHFVESSLVLAQIIRPYDGERHGLTNMTVSTIAPLIRRWLSRKGFTEEDDVVELERAGGCLTTALLMLLRVRHKRPGPAQREHSGFSRSREPGFETMDPRRLSEVRAVFEKVAERNLKGHMSSTIPLGSLSNRDTTHLSQIHIPLMFAVYRFMRFFFINILL